MTNGCLRPATIRDTGTRHPKLVRLYRAEWQLRGLSVPPVFSQPRPTRPHIERFLLGGRVWEEELNPQAPA